MVNSINILVEYVDLGKDLLRALSFDLINKIDKSLIILYSKESNKLNIVCNASKTLDDNKKVNASLIIEKICSSIAGAGGGQKNYASGSGPIKSNIEEIIKKVLNEIL